MPHQLDADQRGTLLKILGFGSQAKMLSSPVPLGGYEGFEIGAAVEYIPVGDLSGLGNKPHVKGELPLLNLSFGKGLYKNVDVIISFTPLPQTDMIYGFGGHLRWGFHEFEKFPAILSLVVHGSGMNYMNMLNTRTSGADLVMGVSMDDTSLFFGAGTIRTIGTFVGGQDGLTDDRLDAAEDLLGFHTVFGLEFKFESLALTLEVDRVVQSTYGARLSYRF